MSKKKKHKNWIYGCGDTPSPKMNMECQPENTYREPLAEELKRMKANMYMTKEVWEAKTIYIDGKRYSRSDLDKLINN